MKTKLKYNCTLLAMLSTFSIAFAEQPETKAWSCQAECYEITTQGLAYLGMFGTNRYFKKEKAFAELKKSCGTNGVLLIHLFKGITTNTQAQQHTDRTREYEERYTRWGVRIIQTDTTVRYETMDPIVRAKIDVLPATQDNTCHESALSEPSIIITNGDLIQG